MLSLTILNKNGIQKHTPNDPSIKQKKEQKDTKEKDKSKDEGEPKRKKIAINKYSGTANYRSTIGSYRGTFQNLRL